MHDNDINLCMCFTLKESPQYDDAPDEYEAVLADASLTVGVAAPKEYEAPLSVGSGGNKRRVSFRAEVTAPKTPLGPKRYPKSVTI